MALIKGRALLVENNEIIALAAEDLLMRLGAEFVDIASSVRAAFGFIERALPSFALLDVNLGAETSFPVAERLHLAGVPFIFATGHDDGLTLPSALAHAKIVTKPYEDEDVIAAIEAIA